MTTAISNYKSIYKNSVQSNGGSQQPDWLKNIRQTSMNSFEMLGLPSRNDEEWKYTSVKPLAAAVFELPGLNVEAEKIKSDYAHLLGKSENELVFVNGVFQSSLSKLNKTSGLTLEPLQNALTGNGAILESNWNTGELFAMEKNFSLLNDALFSDGVYMNVEKGCVLKEPIHFVFLADQTSGSKIFSSRNLLLIGEQAQAGVLETHAGPGGVQYFSNSITDIIIKQNAEFNYVARQLEGNKAYHIQATRVNQAQDSRFGNFVYTAGSRFTRNNLSITLSGKGCYSALDGLYLTKDSQLVDNHTQVVHKEPHCESSQLYKGLLRDKSTAVFSGKIFVEQKAQLTNAYQMNRNLILDKDASVNTKPQLEIFADDVKCSHGATIGQLSEEEVFYFQARGIEKQEAINFLSKGFAMEVVENIKNESLRAILMEEAEGYFERAVNGPSTGLGTV